ncbi:MAG: alcohol dehydrogenase catalytic domain-containing protein [Deltaproteobacteria bacterium]|nr:alcohol dehydrogenase catalytic domain-containing protein [Deltaproteobacteria bacterium]
MKAVVVEEIGSFTIRDIDIPQPGKGEVLIQVAVTGLCRTDLKLIRVGHRDLVLPRIPGEEVVGRICQLGENVNRYALDQRVYVYPGTSCGQCGPCKAGAGNLCRKMKIMGFHRHGGFAEYVLAPVDSLIPLPDTLTDAEAVFAEPLSCCLNALEQANLKARERIGIWGAGPAGTLLARASLAMKAAPFIIEPDDARRPLQNGYATPPEMKFDVAVVAVGSADGYGQALAHLNDRGRLVVFSGLPPEGAGQRVDFNALHYHEQTISGAYGCAFRHGQLALEYINDGRIKVSDMVSHRLPLEELDQALDLVEKRQCMKIHLYP